MFFQCSTACRCIQDVLQFIISFLNCFKYIELASLVICTGHIVFPVSKQRKHGSGRGRKIGHESNNGEEDDTATTNQQDEKQGKDPSQSFLGLNGACGMHLYTHLSFSDAHRCSNTSQSNQFDSVDFSLHAIFAFFRTFF